MTESSFAETFPVEMDREIRLFAETVQQDYARLSRAGASVQESRRVAETVRQRWKAGGPVMAHTSDHRLPVGELNLTVRLFEPTLDRGVPALVYIHGGGWTLFSLETHDRLMREYAARTGIKVIGVDYSLAPEVKFPRQVHEVVAVLYWLRQSGAGLGIDRQRVAIGGDSAGANLALAACLELRDAGFVPPPRAMVLNYGVWDGSTAFDTDVLEAPSDYLLTHEEMKGFWRNYVRGPEDLSDPLACPVRADLHGLPPAFMAIADRDILLDENLVMASRLIQAGVRVKPVVYPGTTHSFLEAVSVARVSERALQETADWLVAELG